MSVTFTKRGIAYVRNDAIKEVDPVWTDGGGASTLPPTTLASMRAALASAEEGAVYNDVLLFLVGTTSRRFPGAAQPTKGYTCIVEPDDPDDPTAEELEEFFVPAEYIWIDPDHLPETGGGDAAAMAALQAQVAQLQMGSGTGLKPERFVFPDPLVPGSTPTRAWELRVRRALTEHDWDGVADGKRTAQILRCVDPDLAATLRIQKIDRKTPDEVFQYIHANFPCATSKTAQLHQLRQRRATNRDNMHLFVGRLEADFLEAQGHSNFDDFEAAVSGSQFTEALEDLALMLRDSLPPAAAAALSTDIADLVAAATTRMGLTALCRKITTQYESRDRFTHQSGRTPTKNFHVDVDDIADAQDDRVARLEAQLTQLRAEVLMTKQPGPEAGGKPKGKIYDNPWTFQLARRKCKHCEAKPVVADIGGPGPGEHWDVHCPQRP